MLRSGVAILFAVCVVASADAGQRARRCKASCGDTIARCIEDGGRPRKCRRDMLRSCKREGVGICLPPATTYAVATNGLDDPSCGTTAAPCRTIQFVLDTLVPLNGITTIKVAAGTYDDVPSCPTGAAPNRAVACILSRQVTLLGGFSPDDWETPNGDPSTTVLDGRGLGRGVRVQTNDPDNGVAGVVLDGFTIENGVAEGMETGTISETWAFGGGLFAEHSAVTLRNVVFRGNRAVGGNTNDPEGGRGAGGAVALAALPASMDRAEAVFENVTFERNEARGGKGTQKGAYAVGGALFTYYVRLNGNGMTFTGNAATAGPSDGNGLVGNELSDALGGAVAIEEGSEATLRNVHVADNESVGGASPNGWAGGGFGGGLFVERADLAVLDAVIIGNTARGGEGQNDGGGSLAEGGGVHAIQSNCTIERALVIENAALGGRGDVKGGAAAGGGMALVSMTAPGHGIDKTFTLRNVIVAANEVNVGQGDFVGGGAGGIWIHGSAGTIDHATIVGNRLVDDRLVGAGVTLIAQPAHQTQLAMTNAIVANHTDPSSHPSSWSNAAVWVADGATADLTRTLFANNAHDTNDGISGGLNLPGGTVSLTRSLRAADAGFVSAGAPDHDYHLVETSPAVDQADSSDVADDVDAAARPSGAGPDVGADELVPGS